MENKLFFKGKLSEPELPETAKSIIIDGKIHKEFKDYCRFSKKKIGGLTEDLIRLYLNNQTDVQKLIDEQKRKEGKI